MTINQLKVGAILNYVIIITTTVVGLVYTPYMLHTMGQSEYGLYQLVASVISYLTVLDFGLGNATIRYTAIFRAEGKIREQYEVFGTFLVIYSIIGLISLIAGGILSANVDVIFGNSLTIEELAKAKIMMLILTFNIAISFPFSIYGSIICAYERFVFLRIIILARTILNPLVMVILLYIGYKAIAMVIVTTAFNILTLILNNIYCHKRLNIRIIFGKFRWDFIKEVIIYSFWIFLNLIMERIFWSTGQFVLGALSGTVVVAVYAIAIQLQGMYMSFSTAISSVLLPKITSMVTLGKNKKEISDLFIRTGRSQNILLSLILFGFIVFGKPFIYLWAGPEYSSAYYMAVFFFVALYIPSIQSVGITILQARNQMKFRSILNFILALIALAAEFFSTKYFGGIGCAISISVVLLLGQGLILNIYYRKSQDLEIIEFWKEILKMDVVPIVVSLIFLYLTHFVFEIKSWQALIIGIFVYMIIYTPAFVLISMNRYERQLLIFPIFCRLKKMMI